MRSPIGQFVFIVAGLTFQIHAAITLGNRLFSDHMVIQRDMPVHVWGEAGSESEVIVSISGQTKSGQVSNGKWEVFLDPMSAGGPVEMTVQGSNTITISDVLIGDVWLGGGQSNMVISIVEFAGENDQAILNADYPKIRLNQTSFGNYDGRSPGTESYNMLRNGDWAVCTPTSVQRFSALMYYIGRELYETKNVPQGLISQAEIGSSVRDWYPPLSDSDPYAKALLDFWQDIHDSVITHPDQSHPDYDFPPSNGVPNGGRHWNKIKDLLPYTYRGIIWWQGEASERGKRYWGYYREYPPLISGWRKYTDRPVVPFVALSEPNGGGWETSPQACSTPVQDSENSEGLMYEAYLIATQMPSVGVTSCLGLAGGIHPGHKDLRGLRGADWLKANVLNDDLTYNGPLYKSYSVEGNKIRISYQNKTDRGLKIIDGSQLQGFSIAGNDGVFEWAQAEIDGNEVLVWSNNISEPKHVRYGWGGSKGPIACSNLSNESDLQAYPFRTDANELPNDPLVDIKEKSKLNISAGNIYQASIDWKQKYIVYTIKGRAVSYKPISEIESLSNLSNILPRGVYYIGQKGNYYKLHLLN